MAEITDAASPHPPVSEEGQEKNEDVVENTEAPEAAPDAPTEQQQDEPETAAEEEAENNENQGETEDQSGERERSDELPPPGHTAPHPATPATVEEKPHPAGDYPMEGYGAGPPRLAHEITSSQLPLTINQLAIVASAQNKLPVSKVKGIVLRLGRHTESSSKKSGQWYKDEHYVDKNTYSWRNMQLFVDHQRHLWTPDGTVRGSCKK